MRGDEFFQEIASRPPLTKLHPRVASFLKSYLAGEKVIPFGGKRVINTQFPPYPSRAFESLLDHFLKDDAKRLYSVTLHKPLPLPLLALLQRGPQPGGPPPGGRKGSNLDT